MIFIHAPALGAVAFLFAVPACGFDSHIRTGCDSFLLISTHIPSMWYDTGLYWLL